MKINWKRVLRIAQRLVVAAPAIADAVAPVIRKSRRREQDQGEPGQAGPASEIRHGNQPADARSRWPRAVATAALLAASVVHSSAQAGGLMTGRVTTLHTYSGHSGLLIGLTAMGNPDACARSGWYILPEGTPMVEFNKAALLTAQATGTEVSLWVDGCLETYPRVVNVLITKR